MVQTKFAHLSSLKRFFSVLSVLLPNGCAVSGGMEGVGSSRGQRTDTGTRRTLCSRGSRSLERTLGVVVLLVVGSVNAS